MFRFMDLSANLGTLMQDLETLAKSRGFAHARVLSKVNFRGELVLGIILRPKASGRGREPPADAREEKRLARERRS
jgi:hypothetical protein